MVVQGVNVWAVLTAAVAAFMTGGVWYGALFCKSWARANRYSDEQVAEMAKKQGRNFAIFFVTDLLMAVVLAVLVAKLGYTTAAGGALLGLLMWLGVALPITASNNAAHNKSMGAFAIDAAYELVLLLVVGAIVGAWP